LTGRRSILRDALLVVAVAAVLGLAALAAQRLLVPRNPVHSDIAKGLDESLGSLLRGQILATRKVIETPRVSSGFGVIMKRLSASLPGTVVEEEGLKARTFEVIVLQSPEINAFTLPGDTICVDTGLIRQLHSAEEMAGVLGHEMSHAVNRDPLVMLVRRMGMSALLNAVSGGQGGAVLGNVAETMVDVRYGREAEDRADEFSVRLLARAGVAPASFADALQVIKDSGPKEPGLLKYLDPHSPIDQRISRARDLARRQDFTPRPLGVDWAALVEALPGK
jgi:beta-barrel assembly-enhancing protease